MRIDVINHKFEANGNMLYLEYKVEEHLRRHWVQVEDFKNRVILDFGSSGINESNWEDALSGDDPKHTITLEMIQRFIEWHHITLKI